MSKEAYVIKCPGNGYLVDPKNLRVGLSYCRQHFDATSWESLSDVKIICDFYSLVQGETPKVYRVTLDEDGLPDDTITPVEI